MLLEIPHRSNDLLAAIWVQHGRRLIQHNTFRPHGNYSRNRHPLFLTAGELIRRAVTVLRHSYLLQSIVHPLPDLFRRHAQILRAEPDILFYHRCNDLIVRILKHHTCTLADIPQLIFVLRIPSSDPHRAASRNEKCIDVLGKRGFPRTIMSENRDKPAFLNLYIHLVDSTLRSDDIPFLVSFFIFKYKLVGFHHTHLQSTSYFLYFSVFRIVYHIPAQ